MSDANLATIQGLYAKFGAGDVPGILSMLDPDVSWGYVGSASDYPLFGPRRGVSGAQSFFEDIAANEEITAFEPRSFHASGDKVFVEGHAGYRIKRTGKPAASDWVHVFTLKDGKITAFKGFLDTANIAGAYRG
jgi:ketosteroid isomerase-like protein